MHIELSEDRMALAGLGVDQHHRLCGTRVVTDVRERDDPGLIEGGRIVHSVDMDNDRLTGAKSVAAVVLGRIYMGAGSCERVAWSNAIVGRHRESVQVETLLRDSALIGLGEVIVRPRLQANGRIEPVATVRIGSGDRRTAINLESTIRRRSINRDRRYDEQRNQSSGSNDQTNPACRKIHQA